MSDILTIQEAGFLADLIRGVEAGKTLRWYPQGSGTGNPMTQALRAFTDEHGNLYDHRADIRDSHVWTSGIFEHWFPVRVLLRAMQNAVYGTYGAEQPMAVIEEAHT